MKNLTHPVNLAHILVFVGLRGPYMCHLQSEGKLHDILRLCGDAIAITNNAALGLNSNLQVIASHEISESSTGTKSYRLYFSSQTCEILRTQVA